ncbi:MAG: BTAD domain-containing putative transcriptional regulator [Caldilineaceae bacterium]
MTPTLQIRLFGGFQLIYQDALVSKLSRPRFQSLLAYLLIYRDRVHKRQSLALHFWSEAPSAKQAQTNLRALLTTLLDDFPEIKNFLVIDHKTLQWRMDSSFTLDLVEFEQFSNDAEQCERAGDVAGASEALKKAIDLYTGDLLPEVYDDWILTAQNALRDQYIFCLEKLVALMKSQGDCTAAVQYVKRWLRHDALSEAAYYQLMELYCLQGDPTNAVRVYQTCQEILQNELQVEPGPALQALYARLTSLHPFPAPYPGTNRNLSATLSRTARERELKQLVTAWRHTAKERLHFPGATHFLSNLSRLLLKQGQLETAWELLEQAFALLVHPSDCFWKAELYRIMGQLLWRQEGPIPEVEGCFLQAIEVAREHNVKFLELRATVNLCTLWQQQGKQKEARQQLSQVYGWFAPGFDALELAELCALLEEFL